MLKPAENVRLQTFKVATDRKMPLLEPFASFGRWQLSVFVRTKHGAERVAKKLSHAGWKATSIHGDRSQSQRNAALRSLAQGVTGFWWRPTLPLAASMWIMSPTG